MKAKFVHRCTHVLDKEATIKFYKGAPFLVEAPQFVDLVITDTEPGFAGNTAQGALKPATRNGP